MDTDRRQQLMDFIKAAFAEMPPPAYVGYDLEFSGAHWKDVDVSDVRRYSDEFADFPSTALHFYTPAILIAIIVHPAEAGDAATNFLRVLAPPTADTVVNLAHLDLARQNFMRNYLAFTDVEKQAVAAFLTAYKALAPQGAWTTDERERDILERASAFWNAASDASL